MQDASHLLPLYRSKNAGYLSVALGILSDGKHRVELSMQVIGHLSLMFPLPIGLTMVNIVLVSLNQANNAIYGSISVHLCSLCYPTYM